MRETFVAAVSMPFGAKEIERALVAENNDYDCTVKVIAAGHADEASFGKIVLDSYAKNCRDPEVGSGILAVGGYDLALLHDMALALAGGRYDPGDRDADQRAVREAFIDFDADAFHLLAQRMPFAAAFYDVERKRLVAARGAEGGSVEFYGNLFCAKGEGGMAFSNSERVLRALAGEAVPVGPCSYFDSAVSGTDSPVFTAFEQAAPLPISESGIQSTYGNARDVIALVNGIVEQAARETLGTTMERAFADYFATNDPGDRVRAFAADALEDAVRDRLSQVVSDEVGRVSLEQRVAEEFEARCRALMESYLERYAVPQEKVVQLGSQEIARTDCAYYHAAFEQVLAQVQLDEPVMLVGPAGSGKNYTVSQIAEGLGLRMYYTNNASNEFKLTGFIDAGGTYRDTEFYRAFKNGGIFFLDEIDNSDPAALIVINSALANGYMAFPHETIERHPDFRCIAAANTWGKGSNLLYVGRNVLDGATLDRFDMVFFDYDRRLEQALYPSDDLLAFMWAFRDSVDACRIPHIVSTRAIGKCYRKECAGIDCEVILRTNVVRSLSQDDLNVVIGAMRGVDERNPYYATLLTLRIDK